MSDKVILAEDLIKVQPDGDTDPIVLAWGDEITILGPTTDGKNTRVQVGEKAGTVTGVVAGKPKTQNKGVLRFALVDVQQGDALVLESPNGQIVFVDGGDNVLFARYAAARFQRRSAASPLPVAAVVVTHGDADHFAGLHHIVESETAKAAKSRLFIAPSRVLHSGIVKGSGKDPKAIFGKTVEFQDGCYIVDLVDDIQTVSDKRLNTYFRAWKGDLAHWNDRQALTCRRIAAGDNAPFDFLASEGISVEVLSPITENVRVNGNTIPGLPLLHEPARNAGAPRGNRFSASHTINGHSLVLRVCYGNVRLLLGGDMNQESMERLRRNAPQGGLQAEIVKVPHHGSEDFDLECLKLFRPVVWLISSGDENSRKEYIHPRANLMGALGGASRVPVPLVFCTELSAFFAYRGESKSIDPKGKKFFFGFERTCSGIVHVRTDGERVLVFTHSGKAGVKEAYRFRVDAGHNVSFEDVKKR